MADILTPRQEPTRQARRDPLDVSADELRKRIRVVLSILGHDGDHRGLARLLRGESTL